MARTDPVVLISQPGDQLKVRLPDGLRERLKDAAGVNKRSTNAETVARLEASFEDGTASLEGEIATLIQQHVESEVRRRLHEIAAKIGGA